MTILGGEQLVPVTMSPGKQPRQGFHARLAQPGVHE
jgi:hypothetical protein